MRMNPLVLVVCAGLVSLASGTWTMASSGDDWLPIDSAELAQKTPLVEKDADAEALFWQVRVDDDPEGDLVFTHYIRIKVYTDRGRQSQSRIDIAFGKISGSEIKIRDIAARTIKPDGSVIELKKDDIFERTLIKTSGLKFKAKSFAMPSVETGCIIEYRWREVRENRSANYVRLDFQRDVPVQRVKYLIKPFPFPGLGMRSLTLNGNNTEFTKEKDGFYAKTMTNMPALYEEPLMPPENQLKTWMLIYYSKDEKLDAEKYWSDFGKRIFENTKSLMKVNDEIRETAAAVIGEASSNDDKLSRLFQFCRTKIKNASSDSSALTSEERSKLKENKSPADTLKRGTGTAADIDLLFAALASAAGYDARIVLAPDRGEYFFDKSVANAFFLEPSCIAVRVGEEWKFFNPGYNYLPAGMLRWQEEGEQALVTDPKQPLWVKTPMSAPGRSRMKRTARLKLKEDGTLEGEVHEEYTGQLAIEKREDTDEDSPSQREDSLKDVLKARMSTAELSGIAVDNLMDDVRPLIYFYHVRVPGYAQRTGKRLFLQPAFFQHGIPPLFSGTTRRYPVYFHFPWSEVDEVSIELPAGYELDNADAPAPFSAGDISDYKPKLLVTTNGRELVYKREFFFGGAGIILFPATSYSQLKAYFDTLHKQDNHTVTLKQSATTSRTN